MTSAQSRLAAQFREQHRCGGVLLPNAWDAVSARIFEQTGFQAIGTTSAGIAYTEGFRDGEQIGRDAMIDAVAKIVRAVSCPVSADIEAGYGMHPSDVAETVAAVLGAGAVGINLEDNAHDPASARLFSAEDQCARIAAARDVGERLGLPLVINARTDTFLLNSGSNVDERIAITAERGAEYLRAGADIVFVPLLIDPRLVRQLADRLRGSISLMAMPGAPSAKELFAAGATRISIGQTALLATLGLLKRIAMELRAEGVWRSIEETFYGFAEAEELFERRLGSPNLASQDA